MMLRIFIGYDSKEPVAFHVLSHSILTRASKPVLISPLVRGHLSGVYTRERGPRESTEFSMTRFLVPYLSDYHGYALFMDCDMLCLTDINEVVDYAQQNLSRDVWVSMHDYTPKDTVKFLGQPQTAYPRKNWSSFMLFNCANQACRRLTPEFVNTATGLELHRFTWCEDARIGSLGLRWNHLIDEPNQLEIERAKILHWTRGGPYFSDYKDAPGAHLWFKERDAMMVPSQT